MPLGNSKYFRTILLYCAAVLLVSQKVTDGAGVIELKLVQYTNMFGFKSGNPKQCCDVMSTDALQCSSEPCDPFFDICLQNMSHSGCGLGQKLTSYVDNQDSITFGKTFGVSNDNNPLRFPIPQFYDNQVIVQVRVYDEDVREGKPTNDTIDYMQHLFTYTPDFNGTHKTILNFTLTGMVSSLSIEINIRCGTFYFGNSCTKRCRSNKQTYDCNTSGDKSCLPGWTGTTCGMNIDECVNNKCQNGASCRDGVNDYTCECLTGFTGRYCESIITTSTLSTSTMSSIKVTVPTQTLSTLVTTDQPSTTSVPVTTNPPVTTNSPGTLAQSVTTKSTTTALIPATSLNAMSSSTTVPKPTLSMSASLLSTPVNALSTSTLFPKLITSKKAHVSNGTSSRSSSSVGPSRTSVITTVVHSTTAPTCTISDVILNLSSRSVSVELNVTGSFKFNDLKLYVAPWLLKETHLKSTFILKTQDMLGHVRRVTFDIQFQRSANLNTTQLKNAIQGFCSPKASHYGRNQMQQPEPGSNNPGPVIGGVFGGLLVTATLAVIGFFIYKRKKESNQRKTVKNGEPTKDKISTSKDTTRACGDGKSLDAADFDQQELCVDKKKDVEEAKVLANRLTIIDF